MSQANDRSDPNVRVAGAVRRLGHTLMERQADEQMLGRLAELVEQAIDDLHDAPPRTADLARAQRKFFPEQVADGAPMVHADRCVVSGPHNPLGIGMQARRDGDGVVATVTLGTAFEGAPGRSHGGVVAAILDDVMGYLLSIHAIPAFTGELTVRYLAPTPMRTELTFRARIVHRDGRRLLSEAEGTTADGTRVASATATFIQIDPARFTV